MSSVAAQPTGTSLKVAPDRARIQRLLDKEDPQYDPSSSVATKRRQLMQEDPAKDIRKYLKR